MVLPKGMETWLYDEKRVISASRPPMRRVIQPWMSKTQTLPTASHRRSQRSTPVPAVGLVRDWDGLRSQLSDSPTSMACLGQHLPTGLADHHRQNRQSAAGGVTLLPPWRPAASRHLLGYGEFQTNRLLAA
jgi:hypothetical protein